MKIIFVTGGIISGIGKGVTASSIGRLFKSSGYSINMMKIDPYLQVDAGTMSPYEHGEVYVTEDGAETDLDVGNYERFVDINLDKGCNPTTGKIYLTVIEKERRGDYLGKTVQVIPHITDEIKRRIMEQSEKADICIIEIGGLVGDAESPVFIEAIRQMKKDIGKENVCYVHVVPLLYMEASGEFKTKAIQLSTRQLREAGIQPDILVTRCPKPMPESLKPKISLYTDVEEDDIIEAIDAKTIYEVPLLFEKQGLKEKIESILHLPRTTTDLTTWENFVHNIVSPEKEIHIAIIGKYAELEDAYMSIREALVHAGAQYSTRVHRHWINAEDIEKDDAYLAKLFAEEKINGVIVPGGFGSRGIEGKIKVIQFARENDIPFLGICLGLQLAVIEFARHMCGVSDATSAELEKPGTPFIEYLPDQNCTMDKGGTLRLGHQEAEVAEGTLIYALYEKSGQLTPFAKGDGKTEGKEGDLKNPQSSINSNSSFTKEPTLPPETCPPWRKGGEEGEGKMGGLGENKSSAHSPSSGHLLQKGGLISDRHRHRYEVSPDKHELLRSHGLVLSGTSHGGRLAEYIEYPPHPFFVATQGHPEFKSRPEKPHPLFRGLIEASLKRQ